MIGMRIPRARLLLGAALGALFLTGCKTVEPDPVVVGEKISETRILNGETDWAHPGDPEIYPYYIQLNDPTQTHHPFTSGERIPDRTYVVFKALARDHLRDIEQKENIQIGISGFMQGTRRNFTGGTFSFGSEASNLNLVPTWESLCDTCWFADTLGFLTAPSSEFTINMQAVDEHGLRDGSPASLSFDVGFPPCLQCIELLPWSSFESAQDRSIPCVDDPGTNPCLMGTTEMRVRMTSIDPDHEYLQYLQQVNMLVDKQTYFVRVSDDIGDETEYTIHARLYRMSILLHGQDDPREAWDLPLLRTLGWKYQVNYDCDAFNQIKDGGGNDDINSPTWGEPNDGDGLSIDPVSGLWRIDVDVVVPDLLLTSGPTNYLMILNALYDSANGPSIFDATTKQFGEGHVEAVTLDQTSCGFQPARPATYNNFRNVRPTGAAPAIGQTWRDCQLNMVGIKDKLPLLHGAMASHDNVPLIKRFRIVVETAEGDFNPDCSTR